MTDPCQLIPSRPFSVTEICRWFQVDPMDICPVGRAADAHIPGDTTSPPPPNAIQIGPTDIS
ncbi:hypothetical protein BOTU111921_10520 [Bordetella tumbae]